jgi:hypothetical protein
VGAAVEILQGTESGWHSGKVSSSESLLVCSQSSFPIQLLWTRQRRAGNTCRSCTSPPGRFRVR